MQKKKRDPAEGQARPYGTLAGIREFLGKFSPPSGTFDPAGSWKQTYAIHMEGYPKPSGWLEIERAGSELRVESLIVHGNGGQRTTATIQSTADPLATPRSWKLESVMRDTAGQDIASTHVVHQATVKGGAIEATLGGRKHRANTPQPFTSNWSLFDAVQRIGGKMAAPLRFALLEDLDLLKPNQVLSAAGSQTVEVAGGKQLALAAYERIGEGILPYRYWLDDRHRLLFVLSGPRSYLYDPEARSHVTEGSRKGRRA